MNEPKRLIKKPDPYSIDSDFNPMIKCIVYCGRKSKGGNPSRDHLANERTVLAYIRTSLNMIMYALILLQLAKYIVVEPVNGLKDHSILDSKQQEILDELLLMLKTVYKYSRPIGALVFAMSLVTIVFGAIRYVRIFKLLFSEKDQFESGLPFSILIFIGLVPVVILALIYTYKL